MFDNPYDSGMYELGRMFLKRYEMGEFKLEFLSTSEFSREALTQVYCVMVKNKVLVRIEDLDLETKNKWWNEVKPHTTGLTKADAIKLTKSIYVLNQLAEL